ALVTSAYGVSFAGLLLLGGRLADLHGPRRLLSWGLATFGAASVAAGAAWTPEALILARFVQGCGAALAAPSALALVGEVVREPARRERAHALWGGLASFGAVLGMLVSGAVTLVSWRWLFAIPAAVAALVLWHAPRLLPEARPRERAPLDAAGALLAPTGLALTSFGLSRAADFGWSSASPRLAVGPGGRAPLAAAGGLRAAAGVARPRAGGWGRAALGCSRAWARGGGGGGGASGAAWGWVGRERRDPRVRRSLLRSRRGAVAVLAS